MRKFRIPLIAICFMLFAIGGYATDLFSVGKSADSNLYKITNTAIVEGARADYTVTATDDTLTVAESGITEVATSTCDITLPSASLGLVYTTVAATTDTISVCPQDADTIAYATLDAGDELDSAGAVGDSVTLICGAANTWYVSTMKGAWSDGGAN